MPRRVCVDPEHRRGVSNVEFALGDATKLEPVSGPDPLPHPYLTEYLLIARRENAA